MRRLGAAVAGLLLCALSSPLGAQQQNPLQLTVTVQQAMLIVETMKAIRCDTVQQMIVCQQAKELLEAIQAQAREQQK